MVGSLEPAVHDRTMSRRRTRKSAAIEAPNSTAGDKPASSPTVAPILPAAKLLAAKPLAAKPPAPKENKRRRGGGTVGFEERIGYRFKDPALLEQALTHISA